MWNCVGNVAFLLGHRSCGAKARLTPVRFLSAVVLGQKSLTKTEAVIIATTNGATTAL